ncbi:hypothetical protein Tco_0605752 [Tanacetum coccineum]
MQIEHAFFRKDGRSYAFLPYLHFVLPSRLSNNEFNKYYDSVDQTLALRNNMPIQRFVLDCSKTCDCAYDLVTIVVQCKVQQRELRFLDDGNWVRLCWDLFKTCNTLVELTLKGEFVLDVPENELLFPRLNKMDLVCNVRFYKVLIDAPKLEYLYLLDHNHTDYSLMEPLSLVEAHISYAFDFVVQLVTSISFAKMLTLTYSTIQVNAKDTYLL